MDVPDLMECDGDRSPQYLSAAWEAFDNAVTARRRAISRLKEAAEEGGSAFLAASVDANESEIAKDERDMRQALARAKAAARGRNQLEADCVEPVDASSVSQK